MSNFIKEWTQKEVDSLTKTFRRHSGLVFVLKFVLPFTALVMAGLLFIYPMLSAKPNRIVLVAQEAPKGLQENPVMVHPRYQGLDSKNQQYQVNAKRAVQEKANLMSLESVNADITLNDGKWVSVVSNTGLYDQLAKFLTLTGDVNVFMTDKDGKTYQLTGSEATVDMDNGIIKSEHPVHMQSEIGTLDAQNMLAEKEKQKITFKGGVRVVILRDNK